MEPFDNPKFKALQKEWDQKLKKSGFEDAENRDGRLKVWSNKLFPRTYNKAAFEAKAEYFALAGQFLHEHEFSDKKERLIWESHAEGMSIEGIVLVLKRKKMKAYRRIVHEAIQNLRKQMLEKYHGTSRFDD